jgi:hypothetical protein
MGDLYLAHDPNTSRLVTIKLLNGTLDSSELRERFAREGRALAALNHPNIVNIYDSGEYDGSPFIVMEYVRGETLDELIKRRSPMSVPQKLKLIAELCAGLAHAHEAGVIHRDIKPANLMVDQQGHLKILDFGIARIAESSKTRVGLPLTQVAMMIGTPGYMSPEQIDGGEVDHRSDIFAAGAVAYELLSYDEAFAGPNTQAIERHVLQGQPASLTTLVPGLDPEVNEIVMRALKREPVKRYQDAATFERALERVRARLSLQDAPAPAPPPPRPAPAAGVRASVREARAEAAYQRAIAARQEGAIEAARRFAVEALAEDPSHAKARSFLAGLEPRGRVPATVRSTGTVQSQTVQSGTVADTSVDHTQSASAPTVIVTPPAQPRERDKRVAPKGKPAIPDKPPGGRNGGGAASPGRRGIDRRGAAVLWKQYQKPVAMVAAVVVVVGLAFAAIWKFIDGPTGQLLTIDRPVGGTLIARGINCGARGSACSATLPEGELVEVRAEPEEGFTIGNYSGDCAPGGRVLMKGARRCSATFERMLPGPGPDPATQTLTILPVPTGGTLEGVGIKCGTKDSMCSTPIPEGQSAILHAEPDDGFTFMGYTGDCDKLGQTKMSGPRQCGANFSRIEAPPAVSRNSGSPTTPGKGRGPTPAPSGPAGIAGDDTHGPPAGTQPAGSSQPAGNNPGGPPNDGTGRGVQPTKPVAQAGDAKPPISDEQYAKDRIQELLKAYCDAYEALDPVAVQRLYPTADMEQLRNQLNRTMYKAVDCKFGELTYVSLDTVSGKANVKADVKRVFTHTALNEKPVSQELIADLVLVRRESRSPWLIDRAKYVAKPK